MLIGIISDIHDNIWALERVLAQLAECEAILCLGDLCAPFSLAQIADASRGPVHLVWGNNDGDKVMNARIAQTKGNVTLHGQVGEIELGGARIAITHYPHIARALAAGQGYALVCYGHDHERASERVGKTLLLNPGEVMGRFGVSSFAIYDTASREARIVEL